MSATPSDRIYNNRYRIDGILGNGGMANVYVGTDTLLRRRVAIKVLREQYATDDDFVRRFSYEAQAAAKLSHPNIVNVYDFGREDSAYYIVMELVDGATLGDLLRDERVLPEPVAVDYAIQIASGLAYAHRQGLLHRDVKPANILVTKDDVVKLSDFGIARAVSEHTLGVTQPGMVMGSVAYISPEQAQGHDVDERSDLYSLGVVLYQMLTGSLPFSGDTPVAVALKHVSELPPVIDPVATGVSPALAAIVTRLLAKSPGDRFASATELARSLREARERPDETAAFADAPTMRIPTVTPAQPPPRRSVAPDRPDAQHANGETSEVLAADPSEGRGFDARWLLFPLLLAVAIGIGYFAMRSNPIVPTVKTVALPNLAGRSTTAAQQELLQRGLQWKVVEESSDRVTADHVIRTDPPAGKQLGANALVTLVVSSGLPRVAVPDVRNYTVEDAQRALQAAHLTVKRVDTYNASAPAGQVIAMSPAPNASVRQNSTVTLTVSKGVEPVTVPNVVGSSVDDARKRLAALSLKLAVGQSVESDTIAAGTIESQDVQPEATVAPNATVTVVVSTGPSSVTVPNVANADPDAAQSAIRDAGLVPDVRYSVEAANPTGKISFQQPDPGTKAKKGSKVAIYLSVAGVVPDVSGLALADAKQKLIQAGYAIGNVGELQEGNVADGQVIRTEPEAGTTLTPGESVSIYVMRAGGQ